MNDLDKKIVSRKIIKFKFNDKIYNLKVLISLNYIEFFIKNKNKLTNHELAVSCITMSNKTLIDMINSLNKGQKIYMLSLESRIAILLTVSTFFAGFILINNPIDINSR